MGCQNATRNDFSTQNIQEDARTFYMMWNKSKLNWLQCAKKWETSEHNFKNTELIAWKEFSNHGLPPRLDNKKLSGSVTIVIKTDTLQIGVVKRFETKKYEEWNTICPWKKIMLPYENTELLTPIVAPSTIKTWTYALIRTMWIFPLINF